MARSPQNPQRVNLPDSPRGRRSSGSPRLQACKPPSRCTVDMVPAPVSLGHHLPGPVTSPGLRGATQDPQRCVRIPSSRVKQSLR